MDTPPPPPATRRFPLRGGHRRLPDRGRVQRSGRAAQQLVPLRGRGSGGALGARTGLLERLRGPARPGGRRRLQRLPLLARVGPLRAGRRRDRRRGVRPATPTSSTPVASAASSRSSPSTTSPTPGGLGEDFWLRRRRAGALRRAGPAAAASRIAVRHWVTINEYNILAVQSWVTGDFPPGAQRRRARRGPGDRPPVDGARAGARRDPRRHPRRGRRDERLRLLALRARPPGHRRAAGPAPRGVAATTFAPGSPVAAARYESNLSPENGCCAALMRQVTDLDRNASPAPSRRSTRARTSARSTTSRPTTTTPSRRRTSGCPAT